jgi:hypothetical protein
VRLAWAIRRSFTEYVRAAEGSVTLADGVVEADGQFFFEGVPGNPDVFVGSVRFQAHDGLLDVTIGDPSLTMDGTSGTVSVTTGSGASRIVLGRFVDIQGDDISSGRAMLTFEGSRLLGDVYSPGSALDLPRIVG